MITSVRGRAQEATHSSITYAALRRREAQSTPLDTRSLLLQSLNPGTYSPFTCFRERGTNSEPASGGSQQQHTALSHHHSLQKWGQGQLPMADERYTSLGIYSHTATHSHTVQKAGLIFANIPSQEPTSSPRGEQHHVLNTLLCGEGFLSLAHPCSRTKQCYPQCLPEMDPSLH